MNEANYKQLIRDMMKHLYALYNRDYCISHGSPRKGYEYLPALLKQIKKAMEN